MLDTFKTWLKDTADNLKTEAAKYRNRDFLQAAVAGCALVAAADGVISPEEKQKMIGFMKHSDALSVFDTNEVITLFEKYAGSFNFDPTIGKGECLREIARLKKSVEQARLLIRVCCAIGAADGNFDDDEKAVVREICAELDQNPADFGLGSTASSTQPLPQRRSPMAVSLSKGGNVSLSKEAPGIESIFVGLGWDVRTTDGAEFDLDASCFLLGANGKVRSDNDFIFYNNLKSTDGSVEHTGDNRTGEGEGDDEVLNVELNKVPADVAKLAFTVTIHEAEARRQNFGMVSGAFIRVVNRKDGREIARFDLSEDASTNTAMIFGEVYRHNNEWKFKAVGQGYDGGLGPLARNYGVNV